MREFNRGVIPPITQDHLQEIVAAGGALGYEPDEVKARLLTMIDEEEIWLNDQYQVNVTRMPNMYPDFPPMIHLSIKRIDKEPIHDWRDLQEIKNLLVGPEYEAVELYPAESRLVDTANQYHLWVVDYLGFKWPFGFDEGRKVDYTGGKYHKQRGNN